MRLFYLSPADGCNLRQSGSDKEEQVIQGPQMRRGEETLCPITKRVWRYDSVQGKTSFP